MSLNSMGMMALLNFIGAYTYAVRVGRPGFDLFAAKTDSAEDS